MNYRDIDSIKETVKNIQDEIDYLQNKCEYILNIIDKMDE